MLVKKNRLRMDTKVICVGEKFTIDTKVIPYTYIYIYISILIACKLQSYYAMAVVLLHRFCKVKTSKR